MYEYGFEEADFLSAELVAVPAENSREAGFDRSMIAGYGHDDRVCAFPSLRAMTDYVGTSKADLYEVYRCYGAFLSGAVEMESVI